MKKARIAMTVVLLAGLTGLTAAAQPRQMPVPRTQLDPTARSIRVEGTGEVKAEPDEGWLDVAVETRASTAKAAGEENARKMERVISALTAAGVPRKEIDTRNFFLFPEFTQPEPRAEPRLIGYRASNTISVHTRELTRLGELIDRALAAGANRVDGVRFGLSNPDAVRAEALRQAVERARGTADVLASALGVRLGPVIDASTVAEVPRFFPARVALEAADKVGGAVTPIFPEEQTITAQVTLVYAIEPGRAAVR